MAVSQFTFEFEGQPEKPVVNHSVEKEVATPENNFLNHESRGRKNLKNIHIQADLLEIPDDEVLFSKKYYPIGVVAKMFKVTGSLIRFWENEFEILQPKKNGKGNRLFRPEDIKNLKIIYHLLREKKYTIEGARDYFKKNSKLEENYELVFSLKKLKSFLLDIKSGL